MVTTLTYNEERTSVVAVRVLDAGVSVSHQPTRRLPQPLYIHRHALMQHALTATEDVIANSIILTL